MPTLSDADLRAAMRDYLALCDRLDAAADAEPHEVMELAEAASISAMVLRKRLAEAGWLAPAPQRTTT